MIKIQHNFERDSIDITKDGKTCSVPRTMVSHKAYEDAVRESMLKIGCSENDINQMTRFSASWVLVIWMVASGYAQPISQPYSSLVACEQAGAVWGQYSLQHGGVVGIPHHLCLPHQ